MSEISTFRFTGETFSANQYIDPFLRYTGESEVRIVEDVIQGGFIAQFRAQVWTHKLPPVVQIESTTLTIPTWNSAWQLWKANHADNKLFGWIARRWPPEKRGCEDHKAELTFGWDRKLVFPEAEYPARMGTPYMQTARMTDPKVDWLS